MDGDGGGLGSCRDPASSDAGDWGDCTEPGRLPPDRTEPVSDLSVWLSTWDRPDVEARGLSVLLPGIFDLIEPRSDRRDSLVSEREKEGYDCRESPEPELPLECD